MTTNKHTLIIGGSSGMGLATARALVAEGRKVTITGRDASKLAEARTRLGGTVDTLVLDLGDRVAVTQAASQIASQFAS
jgi:NADP-dependent 3-hydroxy acid dehydrogenase YdfG